MTTFKRDTIGMFKHVEHLKHMLCGEKIGVEAHREIYELLYDKTCVVKIEDQRVYEIEHTFPTWIRTKNVRQHTYQNILEWEMWKNAEKEGESATKWLAPCVHISLCGKALIQKKTIPSNKYPDKIPIWLTDTEKSDFGIYENKLVCNNYAIKTVTNPDIFKSTLEVF